jgi:hypothetical protein
MVLTLPAWVMEFLGKNTVVGEPNDIPSSQAKERKNTKRRVSDEESATAAIHALLSDMQPTTQEGFLLQVNS